jgi:hypothetical protein
LTSRWPEDFVVMIASPGYIPAGPSSRTVKIKATARLGKIRADRFAAKPDRAANGNPAKRASTTAHDRDCECN